MGEGVPWLGRMPLPPSASLREQRSPAPFAPQPFAGEATMLEMFRYIPVLLAAMGFAV